MGDEEIFDVVNAVDEVVGQAPRSEVHREGWRHRAVHVFVFNSAGRLFLQKRSEFKDTHPRTWDSSTSGHVDSGEDYDTAVVRELREEIGLDLAATPERLFKVDACEATGAEFVWLYRAESEGPFELHPEEIETGGWFEVGEIDEWIVRAPDDFAPAFVHLWRLARSAGRC